MNAEIDVRRILPTIRVPTLVLHRTGDRCLLVDEGRYVASLIPHAQFVELPGEDHLPFVGDQDALLGEIERFLKPSRARDINHDRVLVTLLCVETGAARQRRAATGGSLLAVDRLRDLVAAHATRFGGGTVIAQDTRVLAVFDGPARAIRCGCALSTHARQSALDVRIGVHTGECDLIAGVPGGVVVEIGSHVADLARSAEVLVTRTVVDLVAGSGLCFADRGVHTLLKGQKGWKLYAARES
jgi:class 3 adenylate cyclase